MVAQIGLKYTTQRIESHNGVNMDTPEYRCYANNNNNNYISGLPQTSPYFPSPGTATDMPTMPSVYQNGQMSASPNFTFTNPTQGSAITHAMPLYTAPVSAIPCLPQQSPNIPGIGAQWQHTVPQNMPWATGQQGNVHVTEFTALPSVPHQSLQPLDTRSEPKASCSFTHRRPKRHHTEHYEDSAPAAKQQITHELMMARMKGLSITAPESSSNTPLNLNDASWHKFQDLEEKLEREFIHDSDASSSTPTGIQDRLPRLRLKAGINTQDLLKPSPILPKTILNDLNKPCMEVVLWKPPGIVRNIEDVLSHKHDQLEISSSEERSLPRRTSQQSVTNVTASVPSLSYGDSCVPEVSPPICSMESSTCQMEEDDMDL